MTRSAPQFPRRSRQLTAGGQLTPAQFFALAQLLRSRDPPRTAARLVLVNGWSPATAAHEAGCSPSSASNAVARFLRAHALIAGAYL